MHGTQKGERPVRSFLSDAIAEDNDPDQSYAENQIAPRQGGLPNQFPRPLVVS